MTTPFRTFAACWRILSCAVFLFCSLLQIFISCDGNQLHGAAAWVYFQQDLHRLRCYSWNYPCILYLHFYRGGYLIRRQWNALVTNNCAVETERGTYCLLDCMLVLFLWVFFCFGSVLFFMHCFIAGVRRATENFYLPAGPLQQRIINEDLTIHTAKAIWWGSI